MMSRVRVSRVEWRRWDSNPRPPACKAGALPTELRPLVQVPEARSCAHARGQVPEILLSGRGYPVPAMHAVALSVDVRLPSSHSLKTKRAMVRHILESSHRRFKVSAAEVGFLDRTQRSLLGFAAVSSDANHAQEVLDRVERFVWSHPEIEIIGSSRHWLDLDREAAIE